jgi:hypothetical protein
LGRAGLTFDQIMGALKGTLNLAAAGGIEQRVRGYCDQRSYGNAPADENDGGSCRVAFARQ